MTSTQQHYPVNSKRHKSRNLPHTSKNHIEHKALPFPQTKESALALLRAEGVCVSDWARDLGLSRTSVVDALRGKIKGNRGMAHRVAVALGLKAAPKGR